MLQANLAQAIAREISYFLVAQEHNADPDRPIIDGTR